MKLRLDEYYYILNINYGWEEIEDYMPDDIADKYQNFVNPITQMKYMII